MDYGCCRHGLLLLVQVDKQARQCCTAALPLCDATACFGCCLCCLLLLLLVRLCSSCACACSCPCTDCCCTQLHCVACASRQKVSPMRPIFMPARARARRALCAPGPGVLVLLPPVARSLMCRAVMPSSCVFGGGGGGGDSRESGGAEEFIFERKTHEEPTLPGSLFAVVPGSSMHAHTTV